MSQAFDFTFVIPAYNCERYLAEAVGGLVAQDIGFDDHVQVVIVNDGSKDGTLEVATSLAQQHPANITVIDQENAGAAAARVRGLQEATGTYVSFLDSDDKWSPNACSEALAFLNEHPEVGICAARMEFFEASEGQHPLNYKFTSNRVVDLRERPDYIQLSSSSMFAKRELVNPDLTDTRLSVSEDFLVMNLILLDNPVYGVISKPVYYYRKRAEGGSAIDGSTQSKSWYLDTPRFCYQRLCDESVKRYGTVLPFIQYAVMYDLQWRIKRRTTHPLTDAEYQEYKAQVIALLKGIDDEIVLSQRNLDLREKLYVLALKREVPFQELAKQLRAQGSMAYLLRERQAPLALCDIDTLGELRIDFISDTGSGFRIEGRSNIPFPADALQVVAHMQSGSIVTSMHDRGCKSFDGFFDAAYDYVKGFVLDVSYEDFGITFVVDGQPVLTHLKPHKFCPLHLGRYGYCQFGTRVLCFVKEGGTAFSVKKADKRFLAKREMLYEAAIYASGARGRDNIKYRRAALMQRGKVGERIWLLSDRVSMAGDNGEALFRYLQENPVKGVKPYFVLAEDSPDYERMKQIGPVVSFGSEKHRKLHLKSEAIISSAGDDFVFDRFKFAGRMVMRGIRQPKFVFLQHGVTEKNVSGWLNRYNKDIALFVTAAARERNSIVNELPYGYDEDTVALTGFPRHDGLLADGRAPKKKLLIAPTWRQNLAGEPDDFTGVRPENPAFESSDYYRFYQRLINDERLQRAVEANGWEVAFLIHPALMQEARKFNSDFATVVTQYDYRNQFLDSAVMVTDFSSVAFDFALLKRPLIYAQFDAENFNRAHPWGPAYFEFDRDGFGPVTATLDETVSQLVGFVEHPEMGEEYRKRVDEFFYTPKTSRCQEVVEAIQKMLARENG